jgi:hypothetical protein
MARRAALIVLCALAVSAVACGKNDDPAAAPVGTTPDSRPVPGVSTAVGSTIAPGTTVTPGTTVAPTPTTTPSSTPTSTSSSGPTTTAAGATTTILPGGVALPSGVNIPAGTSADDKAWCAQAKPVSGGLTNLLNLTPAQFETLVSQANNLAPTAPAAIKSYLQVLADVGSRFLAAVKAGRATISANGIAAWANANLSSTEQQNFLNAAGTITSYINRTC